MTIISRWEIDSLFQDQLDVNQKQRELFKQHFARTMEVYDWMEETKRKVPYTAPLTFEQKIDKLTHLLELYGPRLEKIAEVMGAMNLDEENNNS